MSLRKHPSPATDRSARSFDRAVDRELREWTIQQKARGRFGYPVGPPLGNGDALPEGWVTVASADATIATEYETSTNTWRVRLVRHPTGGWIVVYGFADVVRKSVAAAHPDFAVLYATAEGYAGTVASQENTRLWQVVLGVMREHVLETYDITDPVEAGEQALVALGAPIRVLPHLLTPDYHLNPRSPSKPGHE